MATKYNAPEYDDKKYRKGIDTSAYDKQYELYKKDAEKSRQTQIAEANKNKLSALRQAYVNRVQGGNALKSSLAQSGIRGGMTETANLGLNTQYGNARTAAYSDYTNSVNQINQAVDQNLRDYKMDIESKREEYLQNQANARWQADREDYANKFNAEREDEQNRITRKREDEANKYQREQAEIQRQTEYWSNYYNNWYSGYSKKDAKKAIETLKKEYASATTTYSKIRLEQALAAAKARLGVIANS